MTTETRFTHVNEITRLSKNIANVLRRLGNIETTVGITDQTVEEINGTVDGMSTTVNTLESTVSNLETSFNNVVTVINGTWDSADYSTDIITTTFGTNVIAVFPITTFTDMNASNTHFSGLLNPLPTTLITSHVILIEKSTGICTECEVSINNSTGDIDISFGETLTGTYIMSSFIVNYVKAT